MSGIKNNNINGNINEVTLSKQCILEMANIIAESVVAALGTANNTKSSASNLGNAQSNANSKSAYSKTEQLLYSYRGFKRIVAERMEEIEDIKQFGVPQTCGNIKERVQNGNLPQGIVLPEESVDITVHNILCSVEGTVQAIALIDKCMAAISHDPYYKILEMRYFEGRTQEDIALEFKCDQSTIARNKSRLVKELAMQLFPDQVINEIMG